MKKLLTLSLALMMSLTLVACTTKENEEKEIDEVSVEEATKAEVATLFDEVLKDVQPGSAGCSLKSTIVAVDFLNFYKEATTDEEVEFDKEVFLDDIKTMFDALSSEEKETFIEAWDMVSSDINSMCGEGNGAEISEKLETAGCLDKGNYPWTDAESIEVYDAITSALTDYEIAE